MSSKIEFIKSCIDKCEWIGPTIRAYITFNSAEDVCCLSTPTNVDSASNVIVIVDCYRRYEARSGNIYKNPFIEFFYFMTRDDGTTNMDKKVTLINDWKLSLIKDSDGGYGYGLSGVEIKRNGEKFAENCCLGKFDSIKKAVKKLLTIASMSDEERIEYKSIQELKQELANKDSKIKRLELLCENKERQIAELKEKVDTMSKYKNVIDKIQGLIAELESGQGDEE